MKRKLTRAKKQSKLKKLRSSNGRVVAWLWPCLFVLSFSGKILDNLDCQRPIRNPPKKTSWISINLPVKRHKINAYADDIEAKPGA